MVRTKADAGGTKVAGAKAPRKVLAPSPAGPSTAGTPAKNSRYSGGNCYNPQPTPQWQKGIGDFFNQRPKPKVEGSSSSSSTSTSSDAVEIVRNNKNGEGSEGSSSGRSSPALTEHEELQGSSTGSFEKNGMISDDDD